MKYILRHALWDLCPGAEYVIRGDDYSGIEWHDTKVTQPTQDQVNAALDRLNNSAPMTLLREERNKRLAAVDWVTLKAYSSGTPVPAEWAKYMQTLRDLPATANPTLDSEFNLDLSSVTWPTIPQ
jgi:hypothetical protein